MRRVAWIAGSMFATVAILIGSALPASAAVLVRHPPSRVCVTKAFTIGVWYRPGSGGSRLYRVAVKDPAGVRIFYRHGTAPSSAWRYWHIGVYMTGRYHSTYFTRSHGRWVVAYRATTRSVACH
jgi:hypothetical protein